MKEILIFGGTTEGRELSEWLCEENIPHTVCVATTYGERILHAHPCCTVLQGRMNEEEMIQLLQTGTYGVVVDATHPYAEVVTDTIRAAVKESDCHYIRLQRKLGERCESDVVHYVADHASCLEELRKRTGNVLLTIGVKELKRYAVEESLRERLYVRVLPSIESISGCIDCGIPCKQIIAMQGPFTEELNTAILQQYQIDCVVTKQSGAAGGYAQKLEASIKTGVPIYVIGQPKQLEGKTFREVCDCIATIYDRTIEKKAAFDMTIAGIGMGKEELLTGEVQKAIHQADILLGAERMIAPYCPRVAKHAFYTAREIVPYLQELQEETMESYRVVILMSGDCSFYSGGTALYQALREAVENGTLRGTLQMLPGISSVSYFASKIGVPYQDAQILSMHGKPLYQFVKQIQTHSITYILVSGKEDVWTIGDMLITANLKECDVVVGYQLSYAEESIRVCTPEECRSYEKDGLYLCCVRNRNAKPRRLTHGISDEAFLRDRVPMTKEEVRGEIIRRLQLWEGAVVYDIGSGTGSVAIEIASLSNRVQVYAIEKKKEACELIQRNVERFQVDNVKIIEGTAPQMLESLPAGTHAFIGGSSGNLKEIVRRLYEINPAMRVVISAITLETCGELQQCMQEPWVRSSSCVQVQVSRARTVGHYHLMTAENPVWIGTLIFDGGELDEHS